MKRKLLAIAVLTTVLTGCTAAPAPEPSSSLTLEPISAEATCTQYSKTTGTLLYNAWNQYQLGITTEAERDAAILDAHTTLLAIEVEPGSELETDLAALQAFSADDLPRDLESGTEWHTIETALAETCVEAGTELFVNAWNGG